MIKSALEWAQIENTVFERHNVIIYYTVTGVLSLRIHLRPD
jgi:hypothetical protein